MPRRQLVLLLDRRVRALAVERFKRRKRDPSRVFDGPGRMACSIAMNSLHGYLDAARVQVARIQRSAGFYDMKSGGSRVFHEIHYYFICWDAIWKRLQVIKKRSRLTSVQPILRRYRVEAEHYAFGRDQLEHYDDWLNGDPKHRPLAAWDHGNLHGSVYTLAGRKWDVSPASLERLEQLVREVSEAVMIEGTAQLMVREMNRE